MIGLFIKNYKLTLILLVLFSAFFIRFYRIAEVPASLYYDEVDMGFQARSLIETHKDYRGRQSPFYVLSFNDPRVPIPAYFTAITTLIFHQEELQVRMPTVILGTLMVLLAFLIVKEWTGSFWAGLVTGLVFTTNPWQIQNSRWSLEQIYCGFFLMLTIWLFTKAINNKKTGYLIVSAITLGLSLYTYRIMSLLSPLIFISLAAIFHKELLKFKVKRLVWCAAIYLSLFLPFIYFTTIGAPDIPRIEQVGIFANKLNPIQIQRNRELDSGDFHDQTFGKSAVWYSSLFHNKPLTLLQQFADNYWQTFSWEFLFISGTPNPRESVGEVGELLIVDMIPFLVGFYWIFTQRKRKFYLFLCVLLLLTPISSSLTAEGAKHGSRLFIFSVPLLIMVGLGYWQFFSWLKKQKLASVLSLIVVICWVTSFTFYLHRYFVHFPIESASDFGFGFKQAMLDIKRESPNYKYIYMTSDNDPPMIYYLFWNHISPAQVQDYGTEYNLEHNFGKPLDKVKTVTFYTDKTGFQTLSNLLQPQTLYLLTRKNITDTAKTAADFPPGIKVIDIIRYPDNQIAFYVIALK